MKKQIAVMWHAESGEFVPLSSQEEIQSCIDSELPVVRWNGLCYDQLGIDGNWYPVTDNLSGRP